MSIFGHIYCCQEGDICKLNEKKNRMANSVDPDETAHYEPSNLDLHYLHRYLPWSTGLLKRVKVYMDDMAQIYGVL